MGRFVSATGQFLLATYGQFSCPPTGNFSCPLTIVKRYEERFVVDKPLQSDLMDPRTHVIL